jgi:hypothetical protein
MRRWNSSALLPSSDTYSGKSASRMHVLSVEDLPYSEAFQALSAARLRSGRPLASKDELNETLGLVGGRLSFLTKVCCCTRVVHFLADRVPAGC